MADSEMTLGDFVATLPFTHLARQQYQAMTYALSGLAENVCFDDHPDGGHYYLVDDGEGAERLVRQARFVLEVSAPRASGQETP
ncbi:MAG: hypothetical protein AAFQ82_05855 [Myxococcota bacterium]